MDEIISQGQRIFGLDTITSDELPLAALMALVRRPIERPVLPQRAPWMDMVDQSCGGFGVETDTKPTHSGTSIATIAVCVAGGFALGLVAGTVLGALGASTAAGKWLIAALSA